ncbi:MAG: Tom37 metaxin N-terminal-like domain-containing protein [Myxococcota bacterium]|nr:Tom37 metaxin N-terminal-like domain-containing protein [Myxococcota bacterium]
MLQLHVIPPAFGLRNTGPFGLKSEMALTHLKQEFELVHTADPRKAPKGKLPFLVDDGVVVADSELIVEHLDRKTGGGLFGHLSPREIGEGRAFQRLAEEHLYWIMVASRWLDDDWWPNIPAAFFGFLPFPLKYVVPAVARREVGKTYHLQGLGRHSLEEQKGFARRDLEALAGKIGDDPYLLGDRLTGFDFAVAGLLAGTIDNQPATWMTHLTREFEPVVDYTERVQAAVGVYGREAV